MLVVGVSTGVNLQKDHRYKKYSSRLAVLWHIYHNLIFVVHQPQSVGSSVPQFQSPEDS
jgi:hypothetical protein